MSEEPWHVRVDREAGEKLAAELRKPVPSSDWELGGEEFFDPWGMFQLYGSYSSDFDDMAIAVLEELQAGEKKRADLGAEMFREMLCYLNLCDYGTSPRVCFLTQEMRALLPEWIQKWRAVSAIRWGQPDA